MIWSLLIGVLVVATLGLASACGSGASDKQDAREPAFDLAEQEVSFRLFVPTDLPKGIGNAEPEVLLLRNGGEGGLPTGEPHTVQFIYLAIDGQAAMRITQTRSLESSIAGAMQIWEVHGVLVFVRIFPDVLDAQFYDQEVSVNVQYEREGANDFELAGMLVELKPMIASMIE